MHCPLVGERVWVSGCRDEFLVLEADYRTSVATIALCSDQLSTRRAPFTLLFPHSQFEEAQTGVAVPAIVREVLRSSRRCMHQVRVAMRQLRDATETTLASIQRTQLMISESDRTVTRWQRLGCKSVENQE